MRDAPTMSMSDATVDKISMRDGTINAIIITIIITIFIIITTNSPHSSTRCFSRASSSAVKGPFFNPWINMLLVYNGIDEAWHRLEA